MPKKGGSTAFLRWLITANPNRLTIAGTIATSATAKVRGLCGSIHCSGVITVSAAERVGTLEKPVAGDESMETSAADLVVQEILLGLKVEEFNAATWLIL